MTSNIGALATRPAVVCRPDDSVETAARAMAEHDVGCVVVIDGDERPVGMLTDRDLTVRVLARGLAPPTLVGDVMTREVASVPESVSPLIAARQMERYRCRRLPVLSDRYGHVVGVLSADDLLREDSDELEAIAHITASVRRSRITGRAT